MTTKKILFVCVENSNRSQMSQAFANMLGNGLVKGYSAGSKPSRQVNPKAITAMAALGYDLSVHQSKSLQEAEKDAPFDAVVTMGCGDACPWMPAKRFIDWQIPDPKHLEPDAFNEIRDLIRDKVAALVHELMVEDVNLHSWYDKGMDYADFIQLTNELAEAGKTTGPDQSEKMVHYTVLNAQRLKRGNKTIGLTPELQALLPSITQPIRFLYINEAWCGDAAQTLPAVQRITEALPEAGLRVVLRDENPELMDLYLTQGTKRSIPILIAFDQNGKELFHWGSKPKTLVTLMETWATEGLDYDAIKEKQHLWYAKDRGISVQEELLPLLKSL
jgi:arsenate reductase (thioredoxin)